MPKQSQVTNKYADSCAVCGKMVAPGAGVAKPGLGRWDKWRVYHVLCLPAPKQEYVPDRFDMAVEDNMRDQCGC